MAKVRHILGLSGGKDSTALALYLNNKYPDLDIEYYFCDTGKELEETYQIIKKLEIVLGKKILKLEAVENNLTESQFDYFLESYRGYLPSATSRWCTRHLKLEPFEKFVDDDSVISYVGIRGDEDREAYISNKSNIQSIFPFKKNMWSGEVIAFVFKNDSISKLTDVFTNLCNNNIKDLILSITKRKLSIDYPIRLKVRELLDIDTNLFNKVVFTFLKNTKYPISNVKDFPLIENTDVLVKDDIFRILEESGVGIPRYYDQIEYEINGSKGIYARSRSGCYFCFFQQKIEWVWLYEQHPELFRKAVEYEKEGFTWNQAESLEDLVKPIRLNQIKREHLKKIENLSTKKSKKLLDILEDNEDEGCAACFI